MKDEAFGKAFLELRIACGLSQQKLADLAGVGRQTVVRAENGAIPDHENLIALCSVLGCRVVIDGAKVEIVAAKVTKP